MLFCYYFSSNKIGLAIEICSNRKAGLTIGRVCDSGHMRKNVGCPYKPVSVLSRLISEKIYEHFSETNKMSVK